MGDITSGLWEKITFFRSIYFPIQFLRLSRENTLLTSVNHFLNYVLIGRFEPLFLLVSVLAFQASILVFQVTILVFQATILVFQAAILVFQATI